MHKAVKTLHNLIIYEAGKSRENASKHVSIGICENWCDTKSVAERRDCGWQFWVRILGQVVILGQNLGASCNFGSESGVKAEFSLAIASVCAHVTENPVSVPNSNTSLGCPT